MTPFVGLAPAAIMAAAPWSGNPPGLSGGCRRKKSAAPRAGLRGSSAAAARPHGAWASCARTRAAGDDGARDAAVTALAGNPPAAQHRLRDPQLTEYSDGYTDGVVNMPSGKLPGAKAVPGGGLNPVASCGGGAAAQPPPALVAGLPACARARAAT